jgi:hypothetical protein
MLFYRFEFLIHPDEALNYITLSRTYDVDASPNEKRSIISRFKILFFPGVV